MTSNEINISNQTLSNTVRVTSHNAQYYEKMAEQYALVAQKCISDCATHVNNAMKCVADCENIKSSINSEFINALSDHAEDKENPHEVTAEQIDTYTKAEVDNLLSKVIEYEGDARAWARKHYSDTKKTKLLWLEQGGYYSIEQSISSGTSIQLEIPFLCSYNNTDYTRQVTGVSGVYDYTVKSLDTTTRVDCLEVNVTNNTTKSGESETGLWWYVSGIPSEEVSDDGEDSSYDDGGYNPRG